MKTASSNQISTQIAMRRTKQIVRTSSASRQSESKRGSRKGITKIFGRDITNTILWTTDDSDFKLVDQYQIHQLFTAITEGAEQPELSNIRRQFVSIAEKFFAWRETVMKNVERIAAMAAKSLGYGVHVHIDLRAVLTLVNT